MPARNDISTQNCGISVDVKAAQVRMFRLAKRDHQLSLAVLHAETKIPTGTLRGWIDGTSMMPIDGFVRLAKVIPDELLSLVLEPAGKSVVDAADVVETDLHDLAIGAAELVLKHLRAQHPHSDGGERIVHTERPDLCLAAESVAARAGKVAQA